MEKVFHPVLLLCYIFVTLDNDERRKVTEACCSRKTCNYHLHK